MCDGYVFLPSRIDNGEGRWYTIFAIEGFYAKDAAIKPRDAAGSPMFWLLEHDPLEGGIS